MLQEAGVARKREMLKIRHPEKVHFLNTPPTRPLTQACVGGEGNSAHNPITLSIVEVISLPFPLAMG